MTDLLAKLSADGFVDLGVVNNQDVLSLARGLGQPVPSVAGGELVDLLGAPRPDGYSSREFATVYGDGAIPFHTDCPYQNPPPRYAVLRLRSDAWSERATLFVDFAAATLSPTTRMLLEREPWYVEDGLSPRRLTHVLRQDPESGRDILGWDTNCMTPYFRRRAAAATIIDEIMNTTSVRTVQWRPGQTVVFDNWRLLHALAAAPSDKRLPHPRRILERVLVAT